MTPEDLDAIRARDAATFDAAHAGVGRPTECALDRRALLAEVDRLRSHGFAVEMAKAWTAQAVDAERARIRAAVEGLPDPRHDLPWLPDDQITRAAVLAAIEGGEPPLGGIEQFQDEDR